MAPPTDRKYSESHEWFKIDDDIVTIGVTQHAVNELTDITFAEMKPPATTIGAGDAVGEIESVKATSDVYCVVAGEIVEVNPVLSDDPSVINGDPYDKGWLVKVKTGDTGPLDDLMDGATYGEKYPA